MRLLYENNENVENNENDEWEPNIGYLFRQVVLNSKLYKCGLLACPKEVN